MQVVRQWRGGHSTNAATSRRRIRLGMTLACLSLSAAGLAMPTTAASQPAAPAAARAADTVEGFGPGYITGGVPVTDHEAAAADSANLPPHSAFDSVNRTRYGHESVLPRRPSAEKVQARSCAAVGRLSSAGARLASQLAASNASCVNELFDLSGASAARLFTDANMARVASGLRNQASDYRGTNANGIVQSLLFLRAGYYVDYHEKGVHPVSARTRAVVEQALTTLFADRQARRVNDANGEVLTEAVALIDSASLNAEFVDTVRRMLARYDSSYNAHPWMVGAVNNIFTVLFRGHNMPGFSEAVHEDPQMLVELKQIATRNDSLLDGKLWFLPVNASRELGRFLGDDTIRSKAAPLVRTVLNKSDRDGRTAPLWLGAAIQVDAHDKSNCSFYNSCGSAQQLAASSVITINYTCSSSIRIKAQQMTSSELAATCSSLRSQDSYFHSVARDPGPVANDYNTSIEVVIYNSSTDYKTYAGYDYGIDTNNGGMYLEGNPAASGNQPRFIAYEAEWLRPTFAVWNLNHEYTHYLDGRFNMYGDFNAGVSTPTIWWIEGFAEYISYSYRNEPYTAAQTEASYGTYTLRTLFDTTYSNDSTRIYSWGYLAAAFMVNKHPNELQTVLGYYRTGNWAAARSYLTSSIGTRYDAEFRTFLNECAAGNCEGGSTGTNAPPTAAFTSTVSGLTVNFTDGSRDSDGSIQSRNWDFGDGTTSSATNPSKTYAAAGSYTVKLTVTDNGGATNTVSKNVSVGGATPTLPECSDPDVRKLDKACQRSGRSATAGNNDYLFIYVPDGTARLTFASKGGTGDADMFYSPTTWATPTNYTQQSSASGNNETIVVNNPARGYHYVTLNGYGAFSGVTISAE